jgi:hypothetical protein
MRVSELMIVPLVLSTAACLQGQRAFKVNADGSGTLVDTVKMGEQAKSMRQAFEEMDKSTPAEKKAKKQAAYAGKASAMGEGVTLVSVEATPDGGERVTYAFKDINKLNAESVPTPDESSSSKGDALTFRLAKSPAGNALLTVVRAKPKPSDEKEARPAPKKEEVAQQIAMMKGMLAGLKVTSVVEVNGKLVKTSSPNASGSTVTLLAMDFDQLDAAALQKLAETAPPDGPPPMEKLRGITGLTVSDPEVTIEFTGKR